MKKLLAILSVLTLSSGTATSIVACSKSQNHDTNSESTVSKDAKVLNDISNKTNQYFLDFLESSQFIDTTQYGPKVFSEFFNSVTASQPTITIKADDPKFQEGIASINAIFKNYLNQINIKIAQEYSNVYVNSYPLTWNLDKNISTLNFINLEALKKLNPSVPTDSLLAVNYQLNISYTINYKELTAVNNFTFNHIVTNDPAKMKQFQTESMAKLSGKIVQYFSNGDIMIDKNAKFQKLYDKFDINYTTSHISLDNIVQSELISFLNSDSELTEIMKQLTWNDSQSILTLLSGAIDSTTNGAGEAKAENSSDHWAGRGFQPEQITPENFFKFYTNMLKVFQITGDTLQLANFNVNLAKISIAGMPLSGIVAKDGKPLNVNILISKEGLHQKLINFGTIITTFMKHYRVESESDHWIVHLPPELFNTMKSKKYTAALGDLTNDFLAQDGVDKLVDINLFTLGNWASDQTWTVHDPHTIGIKRYGYWNFDFMFGNRKVDNSIFYTPLTSWHFYLNFKDDL
ncbi:lipoprotein [Spiroplasma sp. DGKH1]|uniref:lipoprotein n=1 Tax=Spiroplasma sp. DGKH1 TaxID=3050074 RepID=UPI0034C6AAB5